MQNDHYSIAVLSILYCFFCLHTYICVRLNFELCCFNMVMSPAAASFFSRCLFVLHSTSDAFFMPVLYPILSAITKINNKPASFLLFGLEDNYDPELLNSISFETKKKIVC